MRAGDVLIALGSSGLHSNGYSLVRHVLLNPDGIALDAAPDVLGGRTLAEELLTPTRVYAQDCLALAAECGAHGFAHVTGGGLAGNLVRVLPPNLDAVVERSTWAPQPIFGLIADVGSLARDQLELTFNLGVGMIAVVPADRAAAATALAEARGVPAWPLGELRQGSGNVAIKGDYLGSGALWR
jgi:phosphoribosylformylglycinamidine cyclo-ligase